MAENKILLNDSFNSSDKDKIVNNYELLNKDNLSKDEYDKYIEDKNERSLVYLT
mgnify:CR=1 FL=1